jgi:NurA-like 5'-3' nuclease
MSDVELSWAHDIPSFATNSSFVKIMKEMLDENMSDVDLLSTHDISTLDIDSMYITRWIVAVGRISHVKIF